MIRKAIKNHKTSVRRKPDCPPLIINCIYE